MEINKPETVERNINVFLQKIRKDALTLMKRSPDLKLKWLDNEHHIKDICEEYYNISHYQEMSQFPKVINEIMSMGIVDILVDFMEHFVDDILISSECEMLPDFIAAMNFFFNYTDSSKRFGEELCARDAFISIYYKILVGIQDLYLKDSLNEDLINLLRVSICTLYNTLIHDSEKNLQKIRNSNFLNIIKTFLNCKIEKIKTYSLLFTAYAANEQDSDLFKSDTDSVTYLLDMLTKTIDEKSFRAEGFSTEEIAKGFEKLSTNDANKQLLVDLGLLPILKKLVETDSLKYKEISLSILWNLAFDERNCKIIKEIFPTIVDDMKAYLTKEEEEESLEIETNEKKSVLIVCNDEKSIKKKSDLTKLSEDNEAALFDGKEINKSKCSNIVNGLEWTLQGSNEIRKELRTSSQESTSKNTADDGHIMISYCRKNMKIVMKIYEAVKNLGYKLWIDEYNMSEKDNLMESMAIAVEKSNALIICVSNGYKESKNCRAEAQYAVTRKKKIIPVIIQEQYKPDGWLGICITGLIYTNFNGKQSFEHSLEELSKHLERIYVINPSRAECAFYEKPVDISENKENIRSWSNIQVKEWFQSIGIENIVWKDHHSGQELHFFKTLSDSSLDTFFHLSQNCLGLTDLKDLRLFFEYIQKL